jgi:hypothetical protein
VGHFCPPGSGCRSIDLIESGSNPDLDPGPKTVDKCTSVHFSTVVLGSGLKWVDGSVGGELQIQGGQNIIKLEKN